MPLEYEEVDPGTSGAGPAYEEVQPREPGYISAFKRGMAGFNIGREATHAENLSNLIAGFDKTIAESQNEAEREAAKLQKQRALQEMRQTVTDIRTEASSSQVLYPKTKGYKEFEQAQGWGESAQAFLRNPLDVTVDVMGESGGQQIKTLPLQIAGALAGGRTGLAVTTGVTSGTTEAQGGIAEAMMELGVDFDDPEAVARAMASPEFKAKRADAMKKAATIGVIDAATAAVAGTKLSTSAVKNLGMQAGVQAAGGGAGEALGSVVAGQEVSPQAVISEMIGEIPGAGVDVGSLGVRKMLTAPMLSRAAEQTEKEALTGLNDVQTELAEEVTHTNKRPKLNRNQSLIVAQAAQAGVDPQIALAIAGAETGGKYNFNAKNPKSSAHGIFQILDETWNNLGGGNREDPALQIQHGLALIKQTEQTMTAELGRKPEAFEQYMGHLLGPQTASGVLSAPDDTAIIDAVRRSNPKNAAEIVRNNGMSGMTVGQVKAKWKARIDDQIMAAGGKPEVNLQARASVEADAAPVEDIDAGLEDLDSMFADLETKPLTPEDIDAALKEEDTANQDPEAVVEAEFLNEENSEQTETIVAEEEALPALPSELQSASPRYGFGKELFTVEFSNDVDKAAYIVANGAKRSPRDADYLQFVMDAKGLNETEARLYGSQIRREIKELATSARGTGVPSLRHGNAAVRDETARMRADSFVSMEAVRTRSKYPNPNDAYRDKAGQLPIVAARDEGALGTTLNQRALKPGEVVAAGIESAHTPMPYMAQMQELLQDAVDKFAPSARVVLTFATETPDKISEFAQMKQIGIRNKMAKGKGLYKINMRNATNLGVTDDGTRNSTTQAQIVSAAWHEFGHVVADEQMTQGMSPELKQKFQNLPTEEYFTEEELATLTPEQATVLREYNALKWQVLNDPKFTAEDFGYAWLSPWKLAHGIGSLGKRTGLESFVKKYMGETEAMLLKAPAREFALKLNLRSDILSPHEYMAEQMSRFAYARGLYEQSALAQNFFQRALDSMRKFFQQLKRGGDIKPGVAFAEWVDSLTGLSKALGDNKALPQVAPKPAKPRIKLKPAAVRKASTLIVEDKSVTDAQPLIPPDTLPSEQAKTLAVKEYTDDQLKNLQLLATDLKYLQKTRPSKYQHYMDLVRNNQLEQFYEEGQMELPDEIADKIRFDTDVPAEQGKWAEMELAMPKIIKDKHSLKGLKVGTWSLRRFANFVTTMRQVAYANPEVAGLQSIEMLMGNYKAFKSKLEFKGLEVTDRWAKLGKEQHGLLEQAMREEHASEENWADLKKVNGVMRFVANERLQEYANKKGLEPETVAVWLAAKNAHVSHMNALQNVLKQKLATRLKGKPKTLQVKLNELGQLFDVIRNQPFLPQTRFGEFAVHVKEQTPDGDRIVHVEFFETQGARDEALVQLKKVAGNRKVTPAMYSPTSAILRSLPPQILTTYAQEFELTDMQKKELRQIADAITRNPTLRKYSTQLAGVTGANKNLHKNFADFMWHSSNNIAKLHYREHFRKGLFSIMADMHEAADEGDMERYDKLAGLVKFSRSYVDHMMNPADEWQKLRAFVVVKQLWGNIKTAAANLTSLTTLWSLAAAQQGIGHATVSVNGAILKNMAASINSAYNRVMRQPSEGAQVWAPDTLWALDQAKSDGLLDESFAAQLATFAQSSTLSRLNFDRGDNFYKKAIWLGMLPQHATEVFVRRTTLVHQFEQYMKKGMDRKEAYVKARGDTYRTQGDNSMMNRPAFMRGKLAPFLIYFGFVQNQIYLLSGAQERARNYREALDQGLTEGLDSKSARKKFYKVRAGGETVKMWMAWTALGGMMGVPGAENADDLMELVAKKLFGTRFSLKEEAFKLAKHITDNAREIGLDINPRSLVHGMGADLNLFGFGPKVDISSSVSMGNLMPGGNALGEIGGDKDKFLLGAMGPLGNVVNQALDVFGDDPSMMKKLAFFMPNTLNNVGKTFVEWDKGVRAPSGGKITLDRETGELRDLTTGENLIRLMGFTPEIISANKEVHWMQKEAQTYWSNRRNRLIAQVFEARLHGDREAMADADEELKAFNEKAPKQLKIGGKDLAKAIKRKRKLMQKDERRVSRQSRFQQMDDEIEENVMGSPSQE